MRSSERPEGRRRVYPPPSERDQEHRSLLVSDELIRRYSRRGNFHSEHATSDALGLPGLVAQGTQVAGPAFGLLLDSWGEAFLAHGEIDLRFVGMTLGGDTVEAHVDLDGAGGATLEVVNEQRGTSVVGTARVTASANR